MLSVASLLNPVKPEPRGTGTRLPSSPSLSTYASYSPYDSPQQPSTTPSTIKKPKMSKDGAVFAKGKIKGDVNYPPFENLDGETRREVEKFQVYPLGKIEQYCRHIPYNSEKKSFLEKTGRESFEVFQYIFKIPGDDKDYTVMWDYNIGLVRITPFFKCCKYSKTTPAKMLNMNPGLKEITHSITGGALAAQGYWMPYTCALLVCTTFCSHIAPALIPIFGPSFPSLCVSPEAPEHGRMIIDSSTILSATADAEAYRMQYQHQPSMHYQTPQSQSMRHTPLSLGRSLRLKRTFGGENNTNSNCYTDTDASSDGSGSTYYHSHSRSPLTPDLSVSLSNPRGWRPANHSHSHTQSRSQNQSQSQSQNHNQALNMLSHSANSAINISHSSAPPSSNKNVPQAYIKLANPLLSAIPRSIGTSMSNMTMSTFHPSNSPSHSTLNPTSHSGFTPSTSTSTRQQRISDIGGGGWRQKRPSSSLEDAECEDDIEYDGGEESSASLADEKMSLDGDVSPVSLAASASWTPHHPAAVLNPCEIVGLGGSRSGSGSGSGAPEKKAAWLLMKLSVKDGEFSLPLPVPVSATENGRVGRGVGFESGFGAVVSEREEFEGPRVKRRRATSF